MNITDFNPLCRPRPGAAAMAFLVAATLIAACGDDDGDNASDEVDTVSDSVSTVDTTDDATGDLEAACSAYTDITLAFNDEPDPATLVPSLDALEANLPPAIDAELTTMIDAARQVIDSQGTDFSAFETLDFQDAMSTVDPFMFENCSFANKLEVSAHEYEFEGLPAEVPAGRVAILFSNHGNEAHEMALMRKADGTTESWDELLELPEEEAMAKVEQVGGGFAGRSGDQSLMVADLETGEYIAICFVPVGTSISADGTVTEGQGAPHFTEGMRTEFTVG